MIKTLISLVIAVVIPLFFAFVLASSTYSRLSLLRRRCRENLERLYETTTEGSEGGESAARLAAYREAAAAYNAALGSFPANVLAKLGGFAPAEKVESLRKK
jgi:hypothetical protein